ncbi:MAG TPA: hypothetical protein VFX59_06600 [Polyangiales bacterium]|nr:hypothetical protein [Polyangiales bacterium]
MLTAYGTALAKGDADRAWALLAPADRERIPLESFRRSLRENPAEARELGAQLRQPRPVVVHAAARLDDGSGVGLVGTAQGFRLEDPLSRFYDQSSPRAALLAFVRAVERARWDVVLRLMPAADRGALPEEALLAGLAARRAELSRVAARLWAGRDEPIEIVGDRATMPYGDSFSARLLREEGLWRVESPE